MCQSRRMWEQALQAAVVRWIFDCYVSGNSLGKIADRLKEQGILPSTGKLTWNWKAISKLLSNENTQSGFCCRIRLVWVALESKIMAAWFGI